MKFSLKHYVPYVVGIGIVAILLGFALWIIGHALHRKQSKREMDAYGMYGVLGRFGAGKTYFMTWYGVRALKAGRKVFANYSVMVPLPNGEEGPSTLFARRVTNWTEVINAGRGALILLDEADLWWESSDWKAPKEVSAFCKQIRKEDMTLFWSSQDDNFVSKKLRRLTNAYWIGESMGGGHNYTMYAAENFDRPSMRQKIAKQFLFRTDEIMSSYDTREIVQPVTEWGGDSKGQYANSA